MSINVTTTGILAYEFISSMSGGYEFTISINDYGEGDLEIVLMTLTVLGNAYMLYLLMTHKLELKRLKTERVQIQQT